MHAINVSITLITVERYVSVPCPMTMTQLQKLKYFCELWNVTEGMINNN